MLPDPDFTKLHPTTPYLVGVRPHRTAGVRLELDPVPLNGKHVIHNYGHGGGGITLSWGCASVATELVEQATALLAAGKKPASVAVLGAGVIGLTTATELHRKWPTLPITVYAKDLDPKSTTSFVAGGQFEPSGVFHAYEDSDEKKALLGSLLRKSKTRLVELQQSGQRQRFGVAERKNYTLDHENKGFDHYVPRDVVPAYRTGALPFRSLKVVGREYSTWLMNPTVLLPTLVTDLTEAKVAFTQRSFTTQDELATLPQTIIVNCTGYGAKSLFNDDLVEPQRGHLVVLQKTDPKQFYFFSGGCSNFAISYAFCRQDDLVLGGTVVKGDDATERTDADDPVFARILSNARLLFGGKPKACKR